MHHETKYRGTSTAYANTRKPEMAAMFGNTASRQQPRRKHAASALDSYPTSYGPGYNQTANPIIPAHCLTDTSSGSYHEIPGDNAGASGHSMVKSLIHKYQNYRKK